METSVNTELAKTADELNKSVEAAAEGKPPKTRRMSDQETFISHLIELRSRLVRAVAVVLAVFVVLFIWPRLRADLRRARPAADARASRGAKMIATGVVTPFMVPVKVTALVAFMIALPYVLYQAVAFVAPGCTSTKKLALPLVVAARRCSCSGRFLLLSSCSAGCSRSSRLRAEVDHAGTRHRGVFQLRDHDVHRLRGHVRDPDRGHRAGEDGPGERREAARRPAVRHRRRLHHRRGRHPPDVLSQLLLAIPMCVLYERGCSSRASQRAAEGEHDFKTRGET